MKSVVLLSVCLNVFMLALPTVSIADPQSDVDYVVKRIDTMMQNVAQKSNWRKNYKQVKIGIEDLKKTLDQGGSVTANPIKAHYNKLDTQLKQTEQTWNDLNRMEKAFKKSPNKTKAKLLINIGVEMMKMINYIFEHNPKDVPGRQKSESMKQIKKSFHALKTRKQWILECEKLKKAIKPKLEDMRARHAALRSLSMEYDTLSKAAAFDGLYAGTLNGTYNGRLQLTIKNSKVFGSIAGGGKLNAKVTGSISGTVSPDGFLNTKVRGLWIDGSSYKMGTIKYTGQLSGRMSASGGTGAWHAKNSFGQSTGGWRVNRR